PISHRVGQRRRPDRGQGADRQADVQRKQRGGREHHPRDRRRGAAERKHHNELGRYPVTAWAAGAWAAGAWTGTAWQASAPVTVPDVVGQTQAEATAALQAAGFVVAVVTAASSTVPIGAVISQAPTGGAEGTAGA